MSEVGDLVMPKWGYSIPDTESEFIAKASGREVKVSPKAAREVCQAIKGMNLGEAKEFLQQVINLKKPVPFRRHNKKVPHRKGLQKYAAGRYPVKTSKKIMEILESAEANALYKGLDIENLRIAHAVSYPGVKLKRYIQRAMGRSSPRFEILCHIEVVLKQKRDN